MTSRPTAAGNRRWWPPRARPRGGAARRWWSRHVRLRPVLRAVLGSEQARRVRVALLAAVCGVGLAAALWYGVPRGLRAVTAHRYFALTSITVEGNRRLDRGEVLHWAGVSEGSSVWDAAPGAVRRRLLSHPAVRLAQVEREFPNRLAITVQERRPVAIVLADGLRYVDRHGRVLGPLRDGDSRDFPIISGLDGSEAADFAAVGIHRALQLLRWCQRSEAFDGVSEIHVDRRRGLTVFPRRPAVALVLGWGRWREKLTRSARVFAVWQGQTERLAVVNLSFRDLVVVTLREERPPAAAPASRRATRV